MQILTRLTNGRTCVVDTSQILAAVSVVDPSQHETVEVHFADKALALDVTLAQLAAAMGAVRLERVDHAALHVVKDDKDPNG